jgi:hypothetical protein
MSLKTYLHFLKEHNHIFEKMVAFPWGTQPCLQEHNYTFKENITISSKTLLHSFGEHNHVL